MVPAPHRAGGRMGGCETHSARPHTPTGGTPTPANPDPPATTTQQAGPFLAPDHRPPLASVKLVRPRPRPNGRSRCGRSSLTPDHAAARTSSCEESQQTVETDDQRAGHRASPPCSLDRLFPHGRIICARSRRSLKRRLSAPSRRSALCHNRTFHSLVTFRDCCRPPTSRRIGVLNVPTPLPTIHGLLAATAKARD
jgi:hypothetical protein